MSHPIATYTPEPEEAVDWYREDLLTNPPKGLDDEQLVLELIHGKLTIEGKSSTINDAFWYVENKDDENLWNFWTTICTLDEDKVSEIYNEPIDSPVY